MFISLWLKLAGEPLQGEGKEPMFREPLVKSLSGMGLDAAKVRVLSATLQNETADNWQRTAIYLLGGAAACAAGAG
jgi:hypothetical protein